MVSFIFICILACRLRLTSGEHSNSTNLNCYSSSATETSIPTATSTPSPTPDPNAPQGYTRVEKGVYYMDTSEKGVDYHYTWDSKEKLWLRLVGTFPLIDLKVHNYIPLKILISSNVQDGQYLVSLSHTDSTSDSDVSPLMSTFFAELENRLGPPYRGGDGSQLQMDMLGMNGKQAYLPITTSTGEKTEGKLSETTGFVTEIVDPSVLLPMIGEGVTQWKDPSGNTFLSTVTGVDADGNICGKIAFQGDIRSLSEEQVRWMLFSIVSNVITQEDQRVQSFNTLTDDFALYSAKLRPDGTKDIGIVFNQ